MRRCRLSILLAASIVMLGGTPSPSEPICQPRLSFKQVHLTPVKDLQRQWVAVLDVDASRCAAESGRFDIRFVRIKEATPDLELIEQFSWRTGQVQVALELWIDEAVHEYAIGYVAPCRCRD